MPATISARVGIEDSITVTILCHRGRDLEGQQKGGENLDVHDDEEVIIMKAATKNQQRAELIEVVELAFAESE